LSRREQSVFDPNFLSVIREWFTATGNIFAVVRCSATAGAREYYWYSQYAAFEADLRRFPAQADVIVFKHNQFPLRGTIDDLFIHTALDRLPDNIELMIAWTDTPPNGVLYVSSCDSHAELLSELRHKDRKNDQVAIGLYAPWHEPDNKNMISALVPLPDGSLRRGIY
jgi:hypothetical protein